MVADIKCTVCVGSGARCGQCTMCVAHGGQPVPQLLLREKQVAVHVQLLEQVCSAAVGVLWARALHRGTVEGAAAH